MAEVFGWREGIDERFRRARSFYVVIAPFLLTGVLLAASDRSLMLGQPASPLARVVVGITTVAMFGAVMAMFA